MIKLIREGSRKYPWILIGIMAAIVIAFVVGMGWWGYGDTVAGKVASVGNMTIGMEEYRRVYTFYQEQENQDMTADQIQQRALQDVITAKVWLAAAKDLGVEATEGELRAEILRREEFKQDGKFDPDRYRQLLAANRWTPATFETLLRQQLLIGKARLLVAQAVALTPAEKKEATAMGSRQPSDPATGPSVTELVVGLYLRQKQQRALTAYEESLKTKYPVEIYEENL